MFHTIDTTILKDIEKKLFKDCLFSEDYSFTDYVEFDNEYIYHLECPGFSKHDIKLEIEDKYLIIEGVADVLGNQKEISHKFTISRDIDKENITAEVMNGILLIHLPKKKEILTKRKIEIK